MLRSIERATRQPIEEMQLPSVDAVNDTRVARFMTRITETLAGGQIEMYRDLLQRYESENNVPAIDIAAALAKLLQGDAPFLLTPPVRGAREEFAPRDRGDRNDRGERPRFEPKFERGPRADGDARHARRVRNVRHSPVMAPVPSARVATRLPRVASRNSAWRATASKWATPTA